MDSVVLVVKRVSIVSLYVHYGVSLHSGILVPGGFGVRGTEGKIQAINWARKQKKPFLGTKWAVSVAGSHDDAIIFTARKTLKLSIPILLHVHYMARSMWTRARQTSHSKVMGIIMELVPPLLL